MSRKKIKVTEKNVDMLAGLIQKYFDSFKKNDWNGKELDYKYWKKSKYSSSYTFWGGECTVIQVHKIYGTTGAFLTPETSEKAIHMESPVRQNIRIGDIIHLDGNSFIIGSPRSPYQRAYIRETVRRYDVG